MNDVERQCYFLFNQPAYAVTLEKRIGSLGYDYQRSDCCFSDFTVKKILLQLQFWLAYPGEFLFSDR